jgi:hypothetical protein
MSDNIFNTNAAADFLNELVPGESPAYWSQRLINARRTDRKQSFTLPFSTINKAAFYEEADLRQFAEFEKARRLGKIKLSGRAAEAFRAFGMGEQGGGSQGRQFKGASANLQTSNDSGAAFVQTIFNEPLMVFAMSPEDAIAFGKELVETGQAAQRINGQDQTKASGITGYRTVTDTDSIKIMRKV